MPLSLISGLSGRGGRWLLCLGVGILFIAGTTTARNRDDAGPVRKPSATNYTAAGIKDRYVHDVGNVRMTFTNWGEFGNPDELPGYFGFEFPLGSENDFLFSGGIWVGAIRNGRKLVSTGTDGDDGTNDFAPTMDSYIATSKQYAELAGRSYIMGAKGIDDDGDWDPATDDWDGDGKPSANWDGGGGFIGVDDDRDGYIDEDWVEWVDGELVYHWGPGEQFIMDTDASADYNRDGNCAYDPEPHIDEDPAGDISRDYIDNDFDGLVDADDPDFDGDAVPGSLDDDGDGKFDEDGVARGTQEFFVVYDDSDVTQAQNPDPDGHHPLDVQVLQRTYAWGEAYAGSFILVDLIVRNVGSIPLTDVHIGLFADADVAAKGESGDPASVDDWNFYDGVNLMAVHGDDTTDADGYKPGIFAMKVVRTPAPLDSLNVVFKNFERIAGGDPDLNVDKFNMMSDDPANNSPPTAQLGDWRFLLAFAPTSGGWLLLPGEELPVTVAFIGGTDIPDIQKNAQWAQAIYDNDFQGPAAPDQPVFWVESYPDHNRIYWQDNSEASVDPITKVSDFEGYTLQRSQDTNNWFTLAQYDIINVLPEPEFERENYNLGMPYDPGTPEGTGWMWQIDSTVSPPDTTGRLYWFDDYEVLRGWTYYYIVRAFDQGVVGAGVLITPVGRSYVEATTGYTEETSPLGNDVSEVFVVPNPYKGSHFQEYSGALNENGVKYYPRKLWFMNLPATGARIDIYTLAGDHIITLEHLVNSDNLEWDMRNKYGQEIVSGIYYYVVEGYIPHQTWVQKSGGSIKIDKFVVLK